METDRFVKKISTREKIEEIKKEVEKEIAKISNDMLCKVDGWNKGDKSFYSFYFYKIKPLGPLPHKYEYKIYETKNLVNPQEQNEERFFDNYKVNLVAEKLVKLLDEKGLDAKKNITFDYGYRENPDDPSISYFDCYYFFGLEIKNRF